MSQSNILMVLSVGST